MNTMIRSLICLTALSLIGTAAGAAQNTQQTKMSSCNADAKTQQLTGAARKQFMSQCLSNTPAAAPKALNSQQQKMKTCNADAKTRGLKGNDRKQFLSTCLKAS